MKSAVFLDRDGVLTISYLRNGRPYAPRTLAEFALIPGIREPLDQLKAEGFLLVIVTNQPDVGKGEVAKDVVETMHFLLMQELPLDSIKVSYATSDVDPFRKPNPGMLLEAAQEFEINLTQSYMIGDRWRDINAGRAAGCRTILIGDGYQEVPQINYDYQCEHLAAAVDYITRVCKI